jgi:hypothetical protein
MVPCPWDNFAPAKFTFCERHVCAWVTQPANAWSNLGYLAVAIWLIVRGRKDAPALSVGWFVLLIFCGSFASHATSTQIGEISDLIAIYLFTSYLVAWNAGRWLAWARAREHAVFVTVSGSSIALLVALPQVGVALVGVHLGAFGVGERAIARRLVGALSKEELRARYRPLRWFGIVFAAAFAAWLCDFFRVACNPDQHAITAHAAWHVLSALSLAFACEFVRRNRA